MKMGGRCPLNYVKDKEAFLRAELRRYKGQINNSDVETMRKEFCRSVCNNILC